jgi:hypothetical protein
VGHEWDSNDLFLTTVNPNNQQIFDRNHLALKLIAVNDRCGLQYSLGLKIPWEQSRESSSPPPSNFIKGNPSKHVAETHFLKPEKGHW